jgi:hypothetical protein
MSDTKIIDLTPVDVTNIFTTVDLSYINEHYVIGQYMHGFIEITRRVDQRKGRIYKTGEGKVYAHVGSDDEEQDEFILLAQWGNQIVM